MTSYSCAVSPVIIEASGSYTQSLEHHTRSGNFNYLGVRLDALSVGEPLDKAFPGTDGDFLHNFKMTLRSMHAPGGTVPEEIRVAGLMISSSEWRRKGMQFSWVILLLNQESRLPCFLIRTDRVKSRKLKFRLHEDAKIETNTKRASGVKCGAIWQDYRNTR